MKKFWNAMLLVVLTVALCMTAAAAEQQEAISLTADVESLTLAVGKTEALRLTITPAAARRAGVSYESSDETVATVDSRGHVKGIGEGGCQVTITSKQDSSVTLMVPVQVVVPVKKLQAEASASTLHIGETAALTVSYAPINATLKSATFSSSRETVATVDENGVVTAVGKGQATITVRSADGNAKTSLQVKVLQQPESVQLSASSTKLVVGHKLTVKATVLPKDADNKKVTWASSDESVATVDKQGRVTAKGPGTVTITATSVDAPDVSASIQLNDVQLAKSIQFPQKQYGVELGQTLQLNPEVGPEETSDKTVVYKSSNPKVISVDENGVVTALTAGSVTITATTADGSRRSARVKVSVVVPVTGVHFNQSDVRVGVNYHGTFTAAIEPEKASNKHMTWVSSDPGIAVVTGTDNRVRISGRQWGRCQVTGTTEDGGYSCTINVDIGSLRRAVVVRKVEIRNGAPYLVLKNNSNMHITSVSFVLTGADEWGNPIVMSARDGQTLYGEYQLGLEPGESTRHGQFTFYDHSNYPDLQYLSIAITGWTSDTGYYGHDGALYYDYSISQDKLEWSTCQTDLYTNIQKQK